MKETPVVEPTRPELGPSSFGAIRDPGRREPAVLQAQRPWQGGQGPMNPIEVLRDRIKRSIPGVVARIDEPADRKGGRSVVPRAEARGAQRRRRVGSEE